MTQASIILIATFPDITIEKWKIKEDSSSKQVKYFKSLNIEKYLPKLQHEFNFLSSQAESGCFSRVLNEITSETCYSYSTEIHENILKHSLGYLKFSTQSVLHFFEFALDIYERSLDSFKINWFDPSLIAIKSETSFILTDLPSKYLLPDQKYLPYNFSRKEPNFQKCFFSVGMIALEMLGEDIEGLQIKNAAFLIEKKIRKLNISNSLKNHLKGIFCEGNSKYRTCEDFKRKLLV
jgi:hypothetical protein